MKHPVKGQDARGVLAAMLQSDEPLVEFGGDVLSRKTCDADEAAHVDLLFYRCSGVGGPAAARKANNFVPKAPDPRRRTRLA